MPSSSKKRTKIPVFDRFADGRLVADDRLLDAYRLVTDDGHVPPEVVRALVAEVDAGREVIVGIAGRLNEKKTYAKSIVRWMEAGTALRSQAPKAFDALMAYLMETSVTE